MVLLRPPYAGARYITSFSDNFKSRISTQLLETKRPPGPIRVIIGTTEGYCVENRWFSRLIHAGFRPKQKRCFFGLLRQGQYGPTEEEL